MSSVVLGKKLLSGNTGPYLKGVDGSPLLAVNSQELQTTDILTTDYLLDVDGLYLYDVQADAPSLALVSEVGYPIQMAPIDYTEYLQDEDGNLLLSETNDVLEPE